ncbi:MAG TPA: FimV/HubP family polar landmark protein [Nitrososphaerales archaeon]|nr:FimV/HubP family polar landmark protein [Nitrososphaerales archaeon]
MGERRLGAIMFTDVVGYTSISSRDESAALELLKTYRKLLMSVFPKYEGRVVKTMGDGFLIEFASAVEAVNCAVELQKEMVRLNSTLPDDRRTMVRVGIHVGDVVHSGEDILGDAVNVASRVEPLAEAGGICVTRQVVDQVEGKVQWRLNSLGKRELRNLPNPIEIFAVETESVETKQEIRPTPPRSRVAILPFNNLSPDPNDRYFADGITEELISTVSKIGELSVISRSSAMRYRDTALSMEQVGRELGVDAILEGSVRKAGNKVRIAAQLIEVDTDRYVWSQSYDRDLNDVFQVQGEIAEQVAQGLKVQLLTKEKEKLGTKETQSPEAYNLYLKGRYFWNERTQEGVKKAIKYFEEALASDPNFARAYTGLADSYMILADYRWMASTEAGEKARQNAIRALDIDGSLAEAHASLGLFHINHGWDFKEGERELKTAMELNANYVPAYHWYAVLLNFQRRYEEAMVVIRRALALDPFSLVIRQSVAVTQFGLGRYQEAVDMLKRVQEDSPNMPSIHYWLAMVNLAQSKYSEAIEEAKELADLEKSDHTTKLDLAFAYSEAGDKEEAARILDEVLGKADVYYSPCSVGLVMLSLGRSAEGGRWLERAVEEHDSSLLYFRSLPVYSKYASSPEGTKADIRMGIMSSRTS